MPVQPSQIQVDAIQSIEDGPVTFGFGATCVSGSVVTAQGGLSVSGILTASSFVGDGTAMSGLPVIQLSNVVALTYIS
tara:strand:- start:1504 stop:1737 length:234 start_codon:yes stop_codon:yes gene_type:complete